MTMSKQERWEKDALAALQAYGRAMRRATAACDGRPTDPDRAALDNQVRAHLAQHPGTRYADALDRVAIALPPVDVQQEPVEFDRERLELHNTVLAFAADHHLLYADALERVLSER
jgi:hypothetical protein